MSEPQYTEEQYRSLGRLVERWARPGNRVHFHVASGFGSGREPPTMMVVVTDTAGESPYSLTHGIEPDGYCHT